MRQPSGKFRSTIATCALSLSVVVLSGCAGTPATSSAVTDASSGLSVAQLQIVDCLLPGQVRKLGDMVYKTQRRPIRTTAEDCHIRGGEYTAYDRADYRTALRVWLPQAKAGNAKAQNYVGEIFEKGLGRTADYVSAAAWYRRAATQGYSRAQINLGFLYERGLGVPKDITKALHWYREASGVPPGVDQIVWKSSVEKDRKKLEQQLATARQQTAVLQQQIDQLRKSREKLQRKLHHAQKAGSGNASRAKDLQAQLAQAQTQISTMEQLAKQTQSKRDSLNSKIEKLPTAPPTTVAAASTGKTAELRSISEPDVGIPEQETPLQAGAEPKALSLHGVKFGRYYALIIGDQNYQYLESLRTPLGDARKLQQVLEKKYGFRTFLVANGSKLQILNALHNLYKIIGNSDNLLIYYAGHGQLNDPGSLSDIVHGYWLPVNARKDSLTQWLNNSVISDHLDRIKARSILVLADSCYAGSMASQASPLLMASAMEGPLSTKAIERGLSRRSRIVISSGGVAPVYDAGAQGKHSLFTGALLNVLEHNHEVMRGNMLFAHVAVDVASSAHKLGVSQTPEMKPIRAAGHAGGDFFFVPSSLERVASR